MRAYDKDSGATATESPPLPIKQVSKRHLEISRHAQASETKFVIPSLSTNLTYGLGTYLINDGAVIWKMEGKTQLKRKRMFLHMIRDFARRIEF